MEITSRGTMLSYSETETGTYKVLYGLRSTPEMGGDPEKVDVTTLNDKTRRFIPGVKDLGDLDFGFFYNSDETNANITSDMVAMSYQTLREYDLEEKEIWFKLTYPDATGYQWKGRPTVKRGAAEVNAALSFTLRTSVLTPLKDFGGGIV